LTQGVFTLIYRATQASIRKSLVICKEFKAFLVFSSFFIFLNDYIIDYCVDYNDDNEMKKWICSQVDDQSMSVSLKGFNVKILNAASDPKRKNNSPGPVL
jgi:hypothetical protein